MLKTLDELTKEKITLKTLVSCNIYLNLKRQT